MYHVTGKQNPIVFLVYSSDVPSFLSSSSVPLLLTFLSFSSSHLPLSPSLQLITKEPNGIELNALRATEQSIVAFVILSCNNKKKKEEMSHHSR